MTPGSAGYGHVVFYACFYPHLTGYNDPLSSTSFFDSDDAVLYTAFLDVSA